MLLLDLPPPQEGIRHTQENIEAYMNQRHLGTGTLYIAESRLSWAKNGENSGLSLEYPHIAIHAVSRDSSTFPQPCLYLMVDVDLERIHGGQEGDSDEEDDQSAMTEVRFVPADTYSLETMYKALNDCQMLHPDPEQQQSDEEYGYDDDDGERENGDESHQGHNENGENGTDEGYEEDEPMQTGQFEDADPK